MNNGRHICKKWLEIVRPVDILFFVSCFNNMQKSGLKKRSPFSIISATMTELQRHAQREMLLMEFLRAVWETYLEKESTFWQKRCCDCMDLPGDVFPWCCFSLTERSWFCMLIKLESALKEFLSWFIFTCPDFFYIVFIHLQLYMCRKNEPSNSESYPYRSSIGKIANCIREVFSLGFYYLLSITFTILRSAFPPSQSSRF